MADAATKRCKTVPDELVIVRPDDMHLHLRDGDMMRTVAPLSAAWAGRALIMPNLKPPVTTTELALAYRERILDAVKAKCPDSKFQPLMSLYLTDTTPPAEIVKAKAAGVVACKLYPAGATTNSANGVTDPNLCMPTLKAMEEQGMLLLIHGEVVDPSVDFFDREMVFMKTKIQPLLEQVPNLRVVLEHATTKECVEFVKSYSHPGGLACTITPQHLLYSRNALFKSGLNPHFFCLPILKREEHRVALLEAATSGDPRFFAGTDSAPHTEAAKCSSCGCAGCFSAFSAVEMYAEAFESMGALDKLEGFLSLNGAAHYGLAPNADKITLKRRTKKIPLAIPIVPTTADGKEAEIDVATQAMVVPLRAGGEVNWCRE